MLTIKSQALYGDVAHLPVLPPYVGLEVFHNDGNDFWKKQGGSEGIRDGERGRFINIDINPFTEYRNREQLTVNLRWRLTSCEIQYLEFALQNCTCKNKTNKENKK